MTGGIIWFWLALTIASLAWYAVITVYIGIRGAFDIRDMLHKLESQSKAEKDALEQKERDLSFNPPPAE